MSARVWGGKLLPLLVTWWLHRTEAGPALRVIGGGDAKLNQYTYVVRMEIRFAYTTKGLTRYDHNHVCTAAALSATWTLTAAHCVMGLVNMLQIIKTNEKYSEVQSVIRYISPIGRLSESDSFVEIISYRLHPAFKTVITQFTVLHNDVALLKTKPIKLAQFAKLSMADFSTLGGQRANAVGFGKTYSEGFVEDTAQFGKGLQVLSIVIRRCDRSQLINLDMYPSMCISHRCQQTGSSLCPGDSGGPLIHSSGIVGLNSMANRFDCELNQVRKSISSNEVALITPISPYIDWISEQMRKDNGGSV